MLQARSNGHEFNLRGGVCGGNWVACWWRGGGAAVADGAGPGIGHQQPAGMSSVTLEIALARC